MCSNSGLRLWDEPAEGGLSVMMGAACGDVAGSIYECRNIRYKLDDDHLIAPSASFTDDTVMTCAVAEALRLALSSLPEDWMNVPGAQEHISRAIQEAMQTYGRRYPYAGYGAKFSAWIASPDPQPYGSWGNGSAMRVSYCGWIARTLEEAEKLAELSARVTHDHPEGIKGAIAVAGCIFLLRQKADKAAVYSYAKQFYNLDFSLNDIRDTYTFNASCSGSVPQAIVAFLEGSSFTDVISGAISIGGDSDTIAAIAGSLAEVIYPIPEAIMTQVVSHMDECLLGTLAAAADFARSRA